MEVVAPGGSTPAPFALCPRYNLLAVGMTSASAAGGDAEGSGASRVEILRLLRPNGDLNVGATLQVDCVLEAPGLRRVAWSSNPTKDGDSVLGPVEELLYPAGLLAGGFEDGAVRIWNPADAMLCDLTESSVKKPVLTFSDDPESARIQEDKTSQGVKEMYDAIKGICRKYSEDKEKFQIKEEDVDNWNVVEDNAETLGWDVINKEEHMAEQHQTKQMELVAEARSLNGPVLGLSFNELYPHWIAVGSLSESICIHDLNHPIQLSRKILEFRETGLKAQRQISCLKWSSTYPCALASTGDEGFLKIWDVRSGTPAITLADGKGPCSSDVEFSWKDPLHIAVSTVNNEKSAAVKIWDMRCFGRLYHEYGIGGSGVVSLSWNRSGQLLAAHKNGVISCCDVYRNKMLHEVDHQHGDLGLTWLHSENVAAILSSERGVKLFAIGG